MPEVVDKPVKSYPDVECAVNVVKWADPWDPDDFSEVEIRGEPYRLWDCGGFHKFQAVLEDGFGEVRAVAIKDGKPVDCNCPDARYRRRRCKHVAASEEYLELSSKESNDGRD